MFENLPKRCDVYLIIFEVLQIQGFHIKSCKCIMVLKKVFMKDIFKTYSDSTL